MSKSSTNLNGILSVSDLIERVLMVPFLSIDKRPLMASATMRFPCKSKAIPSGLPFVFEKIPLSLIIIPLSYPT